MKSKNLTEMQERFAREYVISMNATDAARKAGYSEAMAISKASGEILQNPGIQALIKELKAPVIARLELSAEHILHELNRIARCDVGEAFNESGGLKDIHSIPEDVRRCIQSIEVDELFSGAGKDREQIGVTRKIKFWDKNKGLELIGKHFKLYTDKVEHTGSITLEHLVSASNRKEQHHGEEKSHKEISKESDQESI